MKEKLITNSRKWLSLIISIFLYYLFHEGSHILVSLIYGTLEKVKILGLGVQVVTNTSKLTEIQVAIFCLSGTVTTLIIGYLLTIFSKKIVAINNKLIKAISYYTTLAFLLLDPLYLSILYKFVGGGDMNGILLLNIKEIIIQIFFFIILIINIFIIVKKIFPLYKKSFNIN